MTFAGLFNFFNQNSDSDEETLLEASQKSRKPKSGKSSKIKRSHSVDNDRNSKDKRQKIDSSPFVRNPKTSKNVINIRRERSPSVEIIEELPVTKRGLETTRSRSISPDDVTSRKRIRKADDPEGFPLNDVTNRSTLVPKPTLKNVSEKKAESLSPGRVTNKKTYFVTSNTVEEFVQQTSTCHVEKGRQAKRAQDRQMAPKNLFRSSKNFTDSSFDPNQIEERNSVSALKNSQNNSKIENDILTRTVKSPRHHNPLFVSETDIDSNDDANSDDGTDSDADTDSDSNQGLLAALSNFTNQAVEVSNDQKKEACSSLQTIQKEPKISQSNTAKTKKRSKSSPTMSTSNLTTSSSNPTTSKSIPSMSKFNLTMSKSNLTTSTSNSTMSKSRSKSNLTKSKLNSSVSTSNLTTSSSDQTTSYSTKTTSNTSARASNSTSQNGLLRQAKSPKNKPERIQRSNQTQRSSKKEKNIPTAGNNPEKAYNDWSYIKEGYGDLLDHLDPDNPDSEVDKVVKYILDQNIRVRHFNVLCRDLSNKYSIYYSSMNHLRQNCPSDLKFGHFSRKEETLIQNRWDYLMKSANIREPKKCFEDCKKIEAKDGKALLKARNVIGCYLAQDLTYIRYCVDVFDRIFKIRFVTKGKFSKEEDEIIRAEVEKNGASDETWQNLAEVLKRTKSYSVKTHYFNQVIGDNFYAGRWSLAEDEAILEHLFKGKGNVTVEDILPITRKSLQPVAKKLHRLIDNVTGRWLRLLKPILLSYHYGILHLNWKESFANYIIDKEVVSKQDIDWKEAVHHFPGQTLDSLKLFLQNSTYERMVKDRNLSLFEAMKLGFSALKSRNESEISRNYREKIVQLYDAIRKS